MTTRRQSIAKPPMEDSYGRLHMNIDVCEIKQVVNILHIHHLVHIMITFQLIQTISHIITSQRSEQNTFHNIFTDKFKERVTLTKSNSSIV